jgi:Ethylbenzene dehydrogenase
MDRRFRLMPQCVGDKVAWGSQAIRLGLGGRVLLVLIAVVTLAGCEWREMTTEEAKEAPSTSVAQERAATAAGLVAVKTAVAPILDGKSTDEAWDKAVAYVIPVQGYSGEQITMKAVYTDTDIYFLISWSDYSHSVKQAGSWARVHVGAQFGKAPTDAEDRWERFGVEDMLSLVWNLDAPDIDQDDFFNTIHLPGITLSAGTMDRWLWAAGSTDPVHQMLDQFIDRQGLHDDSGVNFRMPNFTDQDDPKTPLNDKGYPVYMPRLDLTQRQIPKLFVVKGEKPILLYYRSEVEPFDLALVDREATLPGYIFVENASGSVADVMVHSTHSEEEETWTLEVQRKRVTSAPQEDIQFDALAKTYVFVIGVFDNTDVDGSFSQLHHLSFAK